LSLSQQHRAAEEEGHQDGIDHRRKSLSEVAAEALMERGIRVEQADLGLNGAYLQVQAWNETDW
jgi:hypothetical protein